MSRVAPRIASILLLCPLLAVAAVAEQENTPSSQDVSANTVARMHRFQYLAPRDAWTIAQNQCQVMRNGRSCLGSMYEDKLYIQIQADEKTHAAIAAALKEMDAPPPTQTFELLLLEAAKEGPSDDVLPEGARKALEGLKGFLPYRSFRLIDTGWFRTSSRAEIALGGSTGYAAELRFRGDPASGAPLVVERFELVKTTLAPEGAEGKPQSKMILSTSLTVSVGETVVLGTSKLDGGDKALVVLLTAVK
ncbi:MAG: hypothetical protein LAO51_04890 [Acidobacteriia bacterium]|nr:hypothetical protein [Terriglobia bacterium]